MMNLFSNNANLPRPLEGIRIVECGIWHAGPGSSAILADLGAEVIKVESLDGEPERAFGALGTVKFSGCEKEDWSILFEISNRNKKGICVDIATPEGKEIVKRLSETADVFLTNYRASTIPKLGVDYATISKINPKIIHITVSGYGANGPMANVGGFDPMGQAMSGMVFLTGSDEPVVLQTVFLDQITAIAASHAMMTALFVRERHGYGQALHVSLYGSSIWVLYANILGTSVMKTNLSTKFDRTKSPALRNCYKCQDGKWMVGTNHPEYKYWPIFCELIGQPQLEKDPRYATAEARAENVKELTKRIDAVILARPRAEWLALFQARGLLFVAVQDYFEVLQDPQAKLNGYIVEVDHPTMGHVSLPGYPVQFSANSTRLEPAPERGEHTNAVLSGIGYSQEEISGLKQKGIIK